MELPRDPGDKRYARKKPCQECPFNKTLPKPFSGGSPPEIYVGQICGPFLLSCHMDPEYNPGPEKKGQPEVMQCAGAAIFRANVGVDKLMPDMLHGLDKDTTMVDATFVEFVARQRGISLEEASEILKKTPPDELLKMEFAKLTRAKLLLVPKE